MDLSGLSDQQLSEASWEYIWIVATGDKRDGASLIARQMVNALKAEAVRRGHPELYEDEFKRFDLVLQEIGL